MTLESRFRGFDDNKITFLAQYEVEKLTSVAVEILKNEIVIRNLDPKLIETIDSQIRGISYEDLFDLAKYLLQLPCPICGEINGEIDITRKGRVVSVLIFTGYDKILICGCKDCLRKEIKRTMVFSLIVGWWGFPMGPYRTIQSLIYNLKKIKETRSPEQSEDFLKFAWANKGYIMTNLDNKDQLFELVNGINKWA